MNNIFIKIKTIFNEHPVKSNIVSIALMVIVDEIAKANCSKLNDSVIEGSLALAVVGFIYAFLFYGGNLKKRWYNGKKTFWVFALWLTLIFTAARVFGCIFGF